MPPPASSSWFSSPTPRRGTIRNALQEPFGPYLELDVLPDNQNQKQKSLLVLHDLELILDRKPSGLNYTELSKSDVNFLGVIEITSPNMLSKTGYEKLRLDSLKRNIALDSFFSSRPVNGLVIKLAIIGKKHLNVVIGSNALPDGLLLISHHQRPDGTLGTRKYHVASMSDYCYINSILYLRRWRFRHLINKLTGTLDPKPKCKWLMEEFRHQNHAGAVYVEPPQIWDMFAAHVQWMLHEQSLTKAKFINVESWEKFLRSVQEDHESDSETDDAMDTDSDDEPQVRLTRSACKAQSQQDRTQSWDQTHEAGMYEGASPLEYVSDSNGSRASSPVASSPERSPSPQRFIDPNIICLIPPSFNKEPFIPDNFKWRCEVEGCLYVIDLCDLTAANLANLDARQVSLLRNQKWILTDAYLQQAFQSMVHHHRVEHLRSWNIGAKETGLREPKLEFHWIKPPSTRNSLSQFMAFDLLHEARVKHEY